MVELVVKSKLGYYFVAIREDQDAAESLGIPTTLYKNVALVLSALFTGLAGAFYTSYMGYIEPHIVFALHDISIIAIMVVMVGGVATRWGPFVGAGIMVVLSEFIRSLPRIGAAHQTLFGLLLIVIIIFLPNGVVGDLPKLKRLFAGGGSRRPQEGTDMALLEVDRRSRAFGGLMAVNDVTFGVEKGETVGLIGPNGAGKTTLFNLINGFFPLLGRARFDSEGSESTASSPTRSAGRAWPAPSRW